MLLLLTSAAGIGFAWDGCEQGCVRAALPPLRMLSGPVQHFQSAILKAWQLKVTAQVAEKRGFRVHNSWMSEDLYNYLPLPT